MPPLLKILITSTSYPTNKSDWRSIFISQMTHALAAQPNIEIKLWAPPGETPPNVKYSCTVNETKWLEKLMQQGGIAHLLRSNYLKGGYSAIRLLNLLSRPYKTELSQIHLFHVNWLQNILPLGKGKTPLLVTVLGSDLKLLKIPGMTFFLRRVLKKRPCIIAPNAEWMVNPLEKRFGDITQIRPTQVKLKPVVIIFVQIIISDFSIFSRASFFSFIVLIVSVSILYIFFSGNIFLREFSIC